jgi:hypothetical protein
VTHSHSLIPQNRNEDRIKIFTGSKPCSRIRTKQTASESTPHIGTNGYTFRKIFFRYRTHTGIKHTAVKRTDQEKAAHRGSGGLIYGDGGGIISPATTTEWHGKTKSK